jgi:Peptidase inhibitor I9
MAPRRVLALTATIAMAAAVTLGGTSAAVAAPPPSGSLAAVTQAATHGGKVIVVLKDQFRQYKIKGQGQQRRATTAASQQAITSDITSHGGTSVRHLVSVNAVAATVSAAEVQRLRRNPDVASIQRDTPVVARTVPQVPAANVSSKVCPSNPNKPLLEPEALSATHFMNQPSQPTDAALIATGKGVKIGLTGINQLAGNPNLIRPDGEHVVIDSPTPNEDDANQDGGGDEWYGDASSISGQGTVVYDFSKELPFSNLPAGCTFRIVGTAPDASLVDTGYFGQGNADTTPATESEAIAGLDIAAIDDGVSVVSESYGFGAVPGQTDVSAYTEANDELVAAGITVVESAGDSGVGGTVEVPAYDANVIDAGASTTFRLLAQAWGYTGWESNQMAALSSGGTTPDNNVVDLVAPGQGGEASCSPASPTCPQTTLTEAFGGTSESAPFIAGAAADVIQAYADSHGGTQPTPAMVKQILTGTAQDIGASSDDQGAGLLDIGAAVRAAQQEPGSAASSPSAALLPTPTQLNVSGKGGSSSTQSVSLYNASNKSATVTGTFRSFSDPSQLGKGVTEAVTAPPASQALPAQGAQAAKDITLKVPSGLSQLGVDMITPNPTNDAVLSLLLFDPKGNLSQVSYDYSGTATGPVSNNEHVSIDNPMPGRWTAHIVWNNGRSHLQDPPPTPGAYRGTISVRFTGQYENDSRASRPVTIAPHSSATIPVTVKLPTEPGDSPESVQFTSNRGAAVSVPVTRRTLVASGGGNFSWTMGSSVARVTGPLKSVQINVPAGEKDLRITFHTADTSPDNIMDFFAVEPNGLDGYYDRTPSTTPQGIGAARQAGDAAIVVADPTPGLWTIQVMMDLTTSGKEFEQTIKGNVAYNTARTTALTVPNSASTTLAQGSSNPVSFRVTNTTGVGRSFTLLSTNGDVSGPNVYIPAGATALVTGTLIPAAAPGTDVSGLIAVVSNGSDLSPLLTSEGFFFDLQTLAAVPYEYTVG